MTQAISAARLAGHLRRRAIRARRWNAESAVGVTDALLLLGLTLPDACRRVGRRVALVLDRWAVPIGLLILLVAYLHANSTLPYRPRGGSLSNGWWIWYDQGKTLEAVRGWRAHAPTVGNQWYQPLYPLLGALEMAVTPAQPFLLIDLVGLLATFACFVPLAVMMGVGRCIAATVFLLIMAAEPIVIANWVIPWNTTLSTPLIFLGLLAAGKILVHRDHRRSQLGWAAVLGAAIGLIPAFRPTDTVTLVPASLLVAAALALGPGSKPSRAGLASAVRVGLVAVAAFVPALVLSFAPYVPVFGWRPSPYMTMSHQIGFDWRLLPLHWIELVVGPRPLFLTGNGMVQMFWWLPFGMAGALATGLALASGIVRLRRPLHASVLSAMAIFWSIYLSYRDLNPAGLWKYNNFHYFVWTFPLLGLYGVLLLRLLGRAVRTGWVAGRGAATSAGWPVAAAFAAMVLSLCWRMELRQPAIARPEPTLDVARHEVLIPGGLPNIRDALLVAASDRYGRIFFGDHTLDEGGHTYRNFSDFRAFSLPGGAMLLPLRAFAPGNGVLHVDPLVTLDPSFPPIVAHQASILGMPCWAPRIVRPASCRALPLLPGPLFPAGHQIDFDGKMEGAYLIPGGWSDQSDGRWTIGYQSSLEFRVPDRQAIGPGVTVEVEGSGFIPRGTDWLQIKVSANGRTRAHWIVSTTREAALRVNIPAALIPPDGNIRLTLSVLNARRPAEVVYGATDRRLIGFRVRAVRLLPWSEEPVTLP